MDQPNKVERVTITDLQGKIVYEESLKGHTEKELAITTNSLNTGVYLINLSGDGFSVVKQVVKE